jgi:hypothetical protein
MAQKGDTAIREHVFFAEQDEVLTQLAVAVASDDIDVVAPIVKTIAATVRTLWLLVRPAAHSAGRA